MKWTPKRIYERIMAVTETVSKAGLQLGEVGTPEQGLLVQELLRKETGRACGDCTFCCVTYPNEELGKPPMVPCEHACGGCAIYEKRPNECKAYSCFWLMGIFENRDRPDRSRVVFDWISEPTAVAHESFGAPNYTPTACARAMVLDIGDAIRDRRLIDPMSAVVPVLVHAGKEPEARLVIDGVWYPMIAVHAEGNWYTFCSPALHGRQVVVPRRKA